MDQKEDEQLYTFTDILDIKIAEESKSWDEMVNRVEEYLIKFKDKKLEKRNEILEKNR